MPKVHRTRHTRLDSLSVAPYDVKTLFGINDGPPEMAFQFFPHNNCEGQIGPNWNCGLRLKIPPGNCVMGQIKSQCMCKHEFGQFLLCPDTSSGQQGSKIGHFLVAK